MKEADNLSPTLFTVYINDLATELTSLKFGVTIGNDYLNIILHADEIMIIAESETNLQGRCVKSI